MKNVKNVGLMHPRYKRGRVEVNNFHFSSFFSRFFHFSPLIFLLFIGCGPAHDNNAFQKLSTEDQNKFQKYLIQGGDLYKKNCAPCHLLNGMGLKKLIPPLANADYLKDNQTEAIKLIKYGATQSITVNGISYAPTMPPHLYLTPLEIAEIITYINNSWGNEYGFVDVKKTKLLLE